MQRTVLLCCVLLIVGCGTGERDRQPSPPAAAAGGSGWIESFDGVPIAYSVAGQGEGTILFIHGWACDRGFWKAQVEAFADEQRVVTVDLAGHGESGLEREVWTIESLGRDVQTVIDALDLTAVVLVGHSMGAPVALEVARAMPDRVVGVIAVDALHNVEFEYPAGWDESMAAYRNNFVAECRLFVAQMFRSDADPERVEATATEMCDMPPEIGIALLEPFPRYDQARALAATPVPVRAINATMWPTEVEINRRHDPDFDVLLIEETGHFPMLERPDEFNRLLRQALEEVTAGATI
jgi:pimeloyl-ACP methyl ester carboxylesterase